MDIVYGIKVQESGDRYISLVEEVITRASEVAIPGAFLVDIFPILKYVPSWFPGAGFQKKAASMRKLNATLLEKPFRYVQEQLVRETFSRIMNFVYMILQKIGTASPSVVAALTEELPDENDSQRPTEERIVQDMAAMAYIGRSESVVVPVYHATN